MSHKLTTVTIPIPYKGAGNVIHEKAIAFDVYQVDGLYSLKPCWSPDGLCLANLPEELKLTIEGRKPVSLRGKRDGNLHGIQDAREALQETYPLA